MLGCRYFFYSKFEKFEKKYCFNTLYCLPLFARYVSNFLFYINAVSKAPLRYSPQTIKIFLNFKKKFFIRRFKNNHKINQIHKFNVYNHRTRTLWIITNYFKKLFVNLTFFFFFKKYEIFCHRKLWEVNHCV